MSIKAKPWEGGAGATVPDASETTKGKIQIATSAEATTGTNDLKAMTPLTVKERIDAALVGGVEYKGIFNVTTASPDLSNAEKGDMYIISGTGALYGQQWVTGDHLLINDDMGGSITNSKIDKVDNTDQVTSVNGLTGAVLLSADDMAADHSASNYTPSNTTIEGHLSGVDSALGNKQPLDAQLTDVAGLTPSNNHVIIGDGSNFTASQLASTQLSDSADLARLASPALTGTPTAPTATSGTNTTQIATTAFVQSAVTSAGGVTSVNGSTGAVTISGDDLAADHSASHYTAANANIDGHLSGIDTALGARQPLDAQLTDVAGLTPSNNYVIIGDGSNFTASQLASTQLSDSADLARLASPALTGTPTAPTATSGTNTTQIATTAFVQSAVTSAGGLSAVVDDTTPQLGGNLDVNGQSITSASGGNVVINPDGAGTINLGADTIPDADATHDLGTESARFAEIHGELEGAVMFKARNETGGSLTKGQAVYISGLSGSTPLISLAQSNSASTMQAFGLLAANVSNNADVKVITFGNLTDIDTSSFSAGDTVFISSTVAGGLVSSAPTGTANLIQNIGKVVRSHASAGIIKVGGAGRTNATPNLNNGQVFAGNASNQAVATALSSIAVTSLNGSAGVVTVSGDDLAADHSASHYTAANANIDGHLSGIDTALGARQPLDAQLTDVAGLTPADGAFIVGNGSNFITESGATARTSIGAIANLSEDTTPQLSGNLDLNGQDIVTTSNADLDLAPDGTGVVVIRGNQTGGNNQGAIKLNCEQNSHGVTIKAPAHSATATYTLTLPTSDGSPDQVLKTDGSGVLSWVTQSGGGGGSVPTVTSASPSTAYTISTHADIEEIYLLTPSASVVVNIPSASTAGTGYKYQIKNLSASYNLTLTPSSSNIDGSSTFVLDTPNQSVTLVSDGSNYFII